MTAQKRMQRSFKQAYTAHGQALSFLNCSELHPWSMTSKRNTHNSIWWHITASIFPEKYSGEKKTSFSSSMISLHRETGDSLNKRQTWNVCIWLCACFQKKCWDYVILGLSHSSDKMFQILSLFCFSRRSVCSPLFSHRIPLKFLPLQNTKPNSFQALDAYEISYY